MHDRPGRLPPLATLVVFESAARLASFTRAANELNVTQGAVSRQVRALEEHLGKPLFKRAHRAVTLTPTGRHYAQAVRAALGQIADATRAVRSPRSMEACRSASEVSRSSKLRASAEAPAVPVPASSGSEFPAAAPLPLEVTVQPRPTPDTAALAASPAPSRDRRLQADAVS